MDEVSSQDESDRLLTEAIIDTVRAPLVVLARDLRVERANAAFYHTFHASPAETAGRRLYDLGNGQWDIPALRVLLEQLLPAQRAVTDFTVEHDFPDLGRRVMLLNARRIGGSPPTDERILLAIDDITARQRSEESLRESEERYRAFSEATTEGLVLHEHGRIIEVNQTFADHLGYTPEEMIGHDVLEFVAPESRAFISEQTRQHAPGPYEALSLHRDGTRTIGELRAREILYHGRMVRVVAVRDITARKRIEEALQESEARLRAAISSIADEAWFTDAKGDILLVNDAVYQNLGIDPRSPFFRSIAEVVANLQIFEPDGTPRPPEQALLSRALRGEVLCGVGEVVRNVATGELRHREVSSAPVRDPRGTILGAVAIVRDVTERKQAEREREQLLDEVQHRAAELDATLNAVADGLIIYNPEGEILLDNSSARHMLDGMLLDEEYGHPHWLSLSAYTADGAALRPEDAPGARAARGETITSETLLFKRRDGTIVWTSVSAAPIISRDGALLGVVSTYTDITPIVTLRQKVEAQAAELEATLSSLADAIVIYTPEGEIRFHNQRAQELLDHILSTEEKPTPPQWMDAYARRPDGTRIAPEDSPSARAQRGEVVTGEVLVFHCPDGREIWVSVTAAPICIHENMLMGVVGTYTDITPLHRLQEQQKVLLQTVSHDLRAPLTVIKGHAQVVAEMLRDQQLDGALRESLAAIDRGVNRMDVMIQDLVVVTCWEGGSLELKREAVPLPAFLDELLRRVSPVMETARITVEAPADLSPVWADYARLERILVNLLSNALKYSDPGTPVTVRAWRAEREVVLAVHDQGRGIPPEALSHLFERFFRAETARATEGVGLGLYITRALVEAHGGRAWAESEVGVGSTFYVTLPVGDEEVTKA
ncbi:MAG TPA: PAS domain-containing sensor histidine kinase [Armatimonadota bacterium]|nr:PAS domain-containing sensor histidine kinase [Armatimonadota bacterium]